MRFFTWAGALLFMVLLMAVSCSRDTPERMHGPFLIEVNTALRDEMCGTAHACAGLVADGQPAAVMREYEDLPAGRYVVTVPDGFEWPLMLSEQMDQKKYDWVFAQNRMAGKRLATANGFHADWNGAAYLMHEVMHLAGFTH